MDPLDPSDPDAPLLARIDQPLQRCPFLSSQTDNVLLDDGLRHVPIPHDDDMASESHGTSSVSTMERTKISAP
jgi:hypothetical protein